MWGPHSLYFMFILAIESIRKCCSMSAKAQPLVLFEYEIVLIGS